MWSLGLIWVLCWCVSPPTLDSILSKLLKLPSTRIERKSGQSLTICWWFKHWETRPLFLGPWSIRGDWENCLFFCKQNHIVLFSSCIYREENFGTYALVNDVASSQARFTWWDFVPLFAKNAFLHNWNALPSYRFL